MGKTVIVYGAVILSLIHIFYTTIIEVCELRKTIPKGPACNKLKNEKCSSYIWNNFFFQKDSFCQREKCPGFVYYENGQPIKKFSLISVLEIIIKQAPALATIVLLFLKLIE